MSESHILEADGGTFVCTPESRDGTPRVEIQMCDGDESTVLYLDRTQVFALHAAALNCLGLADEQIRKRGPTEGDAENMRRTEALRLMNQPTPSAEVEGE